MRAEGCQVLVTLRGDGLEARKVFAQFEGVETGGFQVADRGIHQVSALANAKGFALMVEGRDAGINRNSELKSAAIAVLPVGIEPGGTDAGPHELLPEGKVFRLGPSGRGKRPWGNHQSF